MLLIDSLAEEHIQVAIRRGEFDDLPGQGKPLTLDDASGIQDDLRVAYRILKNAGCLPPVMTLRNEIHRLEGLLDQAEMGVEEQAVRRRLCLLKVRLAMHGHDGNLLLRERAYREKLICRISRADEGSARAAQTESPATGSASV